MRNTGVIPSGSAAHAEKYNARIIFISLIFSLAFTGLAAGQDGAAVFKQNCGVCHRVGGGKMVGPDLIGITSKRSKDWLFKWVRGSQALIKSGDADAKKIYEEYQSIMPDLPLSDADLQAIFSFIDSKSSTASTGADTTKAGPPPPDASLTASDLEVETGKNFFIGQGQFSGGGPACISCHNVNYTGVIPGGLLAKDLTGAYTRLGGDAGISGILGAPPFAAMTQAYKDRPLTEKEIASICAFLSKVDRDKPNQYSAAVNPLAAGGFAGLAVLLGMIFFIWYRRKKVSVKKAIYHRQIKSI
jgi:mono/diheme cytochrome c family protein